MTFAQYVSVPFYPGCNPPEILKKILSIGALLLVMTVNGLSVKFSSKVNIFFTAAKLLLVLAIILAGIVELSQGNTQNFENAWEGTSSSASAWATAIFNGMWSYGNGQIFISYTLQIVTLK